MAGPQTMQVSDSYNGFISSISDKPEAFLHPTDALYAASLIVSKRLIDPLAQSNSVFDQLYTDDMHVDQIWEQIKTITENVVDDVLAMNLDNQFKQNGAANTQIEEPYIESDPEDVSGEDDMQLNGSDLGSDMQDELQDDLSEEAEEDDEIADADALSDDEIGDLSAFVDDEDVEEDEGESLTDAAESKTTDGDEFFDAEEFNKQMDAMDANYEQEQEADDIDYNADPDEASDDELDVSGGEENANELRYDDFFARPKARGRKANNSKPRRAHFATEEDEQSEDGADENGDTTMARMQKDLFADEDVEEDEEPGTKLSGHAKRQLRLAEEIRRLENDNVAKKDWALMGEASARARPKDSLLEEGLDFERTSRPVPVVTEEVTQTLEDMIKARIIEGRFDTVLRRIPEYAHKFTKNSFELDENKPMQSLAEVYETEFQKKQNPTAYQSAADKKLEADHKEVETLFRDLCYNLDALSSWHYTPKPVTESLNIVTNAPAITMEDAQPLTMSSASRLAPQEEFSATAEKGEVAGKSGLPVSKAEMTSEERQRYRRKQRATAKKSGAQKKTEYANLSKSKQEQAGVVDTLKRANVKVIRNGKTRDLKSGKEYAAAAALKSSNLKL